MAELDKAALKVQNDTLLPDNITQSISPTDHRSVNSDVIDSCLNNTELGAQTILGAVDFAGGATVEGNQIAQMENVVWINSLADFPAPNGSDEIELGTGVNTAYYIGSVAIDISPNVLINTLGDSVLIKGIHPVESQLTSDSVSPLIDTDSGSIGVENIILSNPNGNIFGFAGNGISSGFVLDRVIINGCKYCAQDITGAVASSFNRLVVLSTSVGGFTFTGATNSQLKLFDNAVGLESGFLNWTGDFIDLQTATFDLITIAENRIFPGVGDNFLTGAALGANLNAGGSAQMNGNIFKGAGTSVTTITGQDDGWLFSGNSFNDGIRNTRSVSDAYLSSSETVTIGAISTFVAVAGANWLSTLGKHFTVDTGGLITYTGLSDIDIFIIATATVEKVGGGGDMICTRIAYNGVDQVRTNACTDNTSPTSVTSHGLFTLSKDDTLQLYVANTQSTSNIIVDQANITVSGNMT